MSLFTDVPESARETLQRSAYYMLLREDRLLTVEEAVYARPDLPPLLAIAADHRPLRQVLAEQNARQLASSPLHGR